MTEKRYYLGNGKLLTICDSSKGGSDGFNGLTKFEVVDLLNEQHETIEQLKIKNENLIRISAMVQVRNDKLKEENEQLKQRVEQLENHIVNKLTIICGDKEIK